jgi:hypothetical protein
MNRQAGASKDSDIIASAKALRRAARRALDIGLKTGTPVYALKGGKIVDLTRETTAHTPTATLAVREAGTRYRIRK